VISDRASRLIEAAQARAVDFDNPKLLDLPSWVREFRPWQIQAVKEIIAGFDHGNVVVLDAPTGSGKTLIAEVVRRLLSERAIYTCHTKALQEQVVADYPYAKLLKGRVNYVVGREGMGVTAADCQKPGPCRWCPSLSECPYETAKHEALSADLAVLNTSYLLTEGNGPGKFRGRGLLILDEADTLENELRRWISVEVSRGTCLRYGLREPSRRTVADSWREWLDYAVPRLKTVRSRIQGEDIGSQRERDRLKRLIAKLRNVREELVEVDGDIGEGRTVGETGWVYTGTDGRVEFKPISTRKYGGLLWGLGTRFLLMSATVISPGAMLEELGWERPYTLVKVDSTFPKENRPIIYRPTAKMTRKNDESGKLVPALRAIIGRHAQERLLVHCVSYSLASYLHGELFRSCREAGLECTTYTGSDGKPEALDRFRRSRGGVLLAPSMDRGIDLPDDDCRVVVIAKVPYPNLGDKQVSARLHSKGGQTWYTVQTVRTVVQMTGRGVRHKDDTCTMYILDAMFDDLWNKARGLFPSWWTEAIKWERI
jgi:ATP-dependent DNA helicase DinG